MYKRFFIIAKNEGTGGGLYSSSVYLAYIFHRIEMRKIKSDPI